MGKVSAALYAPPHQLVLEDVHQQRDGRQVPIDQVGVSHIQHPIVVLDRNGEQQHTVAQLSMSVNLPHQAKGIHLSRFMEVLNEYQGEIAMDKLPIILGILKSRLGADMASVDVSFPYFLKRAAPVSGSQGLMNYDCTFHGEINCEVDDYVLSVRVPVTALCPCSRTISDYGAHNQRGWVTLEVRTARSEDGTPLRICIEDLIEVAESSGSAPVYPVLKRQDERYVTMQAYDNPTFVEDIVRNAVVQLRSDHRIAQFRVHVMNEESIHRHNVFANVVWSRL